MKLSRRLLGSQFIKYTLRAVKVTIPSVLTRGRVVSNWLAARRERRANDKSMANTIAVFFMGNTSQKVLDLCRERERERDFNDKSCSLSVVSLAVAVHSLENGYIPYSKFWILYVSTTPQAYL